MATDDELPEELDRLEITPILQQAKLLNSDLSVQSNPFENDLKEKESQINVDEIINATQRQPSLSLIPSRLPINCRRCRYLRASESVVEELKHASSNALSDLAESMRAPSNGVLKQPLKKSISSVSCGPKNRKILLKEPILKAIQSCLHPHSNVRRKLLVSTTISTGSQDNDNQLATKGMCDFRDLIDECQNLLSEDVDFSGRANPLSLVNRNSKNFTTIQNSKTQNSNKLQNNKRGILNMALMPSSLLSSMSSATVTTLERNNQAMPLFQLPTLGNNINSTISQQRSSSNLSPEHASTHARYRTSCSLQAGNSAATGVCDDVTIDELASYFDTFVHIPKKMSSMAEMMYI